MTKFVFRPKRRKDGKLITSRLFSGRFQVTGEVKVTTIPLNVSDKQVAKAMLDKIVKEREQEAIGIIAPRCQRDAAMRPLLSHVDDYLRDLRTQNRDGEYIYILEKRLARLFAECGWQFMRDVSIDSFVAWRSRQKSAPQTLNQYLECARSLFNWMMPHRITSNPLSSVEKIDERGKQRRKRRAYLDEQLQQVLAVAGEWRVGYLAAVHTGLRRSELMAMEWRNFELDCVTPRLVLDAEFTKNKEIARLPLNSELANELRRVKPADSASTDKVFSNRNLPSIYMLKKHLKRAGIPYTDESGKTADFHALRHTLATNLAKQNIPPRLAMEMMRHSDIRLTMKTYTDADCLPLQQVLSALPKFLPASENAVAMNTQIDTQTPDASGQTLSSPVADGGGEFLSEVPQNQGLLHNLTPADTLRHSCILAASLGFEPRQNDSESFVLPLHHEAMLGSESGRRK